MPIRLDSPTKPNSKTRIGVKQQIAATIVPIMPTLRSLFVSMPLSQRLTEPCSAQDGLIGSSPGTAIRKHAVDDNSRHRSNAKPFGTRGNTLVPHVENADIAGRTGSIPDLADRPFTNSAAGAENLDLSLGRHANSLLILKGYETG